MKKLFILLGTFAFAAQLFAAEQPLRFGPYDSGWYPDDTYAFYMTGVHKASPSVEMNMGIFILAAVQEVAEVPVYAHLMLSSADLTIEGVGKASGMGDMQFVISPRLLHWNGGHLNIGASVAAPTGSYDKERTLNIGDNRWTFSPMLAIAQQVGWVHLELWGGYDFYTKNNDYRYYNPVTYTTQDAELEKDGNFFAELHVTLGLQRETRTNLTFSLGGIWGGEETAKAGGASYLSSDKMADYACKLTFGTQLTDSASIYLIYTHDLHIENGEKGYSIATKLAKLF
jgi:hypothetical protein